MEDYNASTMQGLTASLAVSITLLVLEQVRASSKCKRNSLAQLLLNAVRTVRAQDKPTNTAPHPTPPPTDEFKI